MEVKVINSDVKYLYYPKHMVTYNYFKLMDKENLILMKEKQLVKIEQQNKEIDMLLRNIKENHKARLLLEHELAILESNNTWNKKRLSLIEEAIKDISTL